MVRLVIGHLVLIVKLGIGHLMAGSARDWVIWGCAQSGAGSVRVTLAAGHRVVVVKLGRGHLAPTVSLEQDHLEGMASLGLDHWVNLEQDQ